VAISLTRIQRSLDKLEENLGKNRKARDLEDVLRAVARSVNSGMFTPEEFLNQFNTLVFDRHVAEGKVQACEAFPTFPKLQTRKYIRKPLHFMPQAMDSMQKFVLKSIDIADELYFSLMSGTAAVTKIQASPEFGNQAYVLKLQGNLYILFAVTEQAVVVIGMVETKT
ncbi:MAG TPA: hypothetical protein VM715_08595, partial [Candidatus Acidoferrum sp.]|nr:hypothetical protein [Candidatus Acidoferrum sp.]